MTIEYFLLGLLFARIVFVHFNQAYGGDDNI